VEVLKFFGESASLAILAVVDGEERSYGSRLLFSVPRRRLVLCSAVVFGCSEQPQVLRFPFGGSRIILIL
jgi:hypothetical protein